MSNLNQVLYQVSFNFQQYMDQLDEVLRINLDLLIRNMHFDRSSVFLLDEKESVLRPVKMVTINGEAEGEGESFIRTEHGNHFSLALNKGKEIVHKKEPEYSIYLPLITRKKKKLGVLRVDNFFSHQEIKQEQIENLKLFTELFTVGIHNILLYQDFKHHVNKLTALTKIGNAMATTLKLGEILELTLFSLVNDMGFDRAQIFLLEENSNKITENLSIDFRGHNPNKASNISTLVDSLFSKNEPYFVARKFSSRLIAYIPIMWKEKRKGLLIVDNLFTRQILSSSNLSFLGIIAEQLATVIENSRLFEHVEKLSITDSLTGLFNHRYFYERLSEEISRAQRFGKSFALLMLDIDRFKDFNDTYGHQAGDTVLKTVAQIIQENIRSIDIASRYGGEEMTIILPETELEGAKIIADRILISISKYAFKINQETPCLTVSIGLVCYPSNATIKSELIRKADLALYYAKHHGRNQVCVYSQQLNTDNFRETEQKP